MQSLYKDLLKRIMEIIKSPLEEVLLIKPKIFEDNRGYFTESYSEKNYFDKGVKEIFVQDNLSKSTKGTLRGLHYQLSNPQAKLVRVVSGKVFDVALDIRKGSSTFGHYFSTILDDKNHHQLFIPAGFAHGFCVLSEEVIFEYKCSEYYYPNDQFGVFWNDKDISIDWPIKDPTLSQKDKEYPLLKSITESKLPVF